MEEVKGIEYIMTYGWVMLIIIVAVGFLFAIGVFDNKDISAETKAYHSAKYSCDLLIHYENDKITNIELLDCIKRGLND